MKNLRPFTFAHILLEVANYLECNGDLSTVANIISTLNSPKFSKITGSSSVSLGTVYGTLAMLKGRKFLKKVLIEYDEKQELGFCITAEGKKALGEIKSQTEEAISMLNLATNPT